MKIRLKYLIVLCCLSFGAKAQLLVSTNSNASTLVNQIVGNNVTITNAVLNCNPAATGLFLTNNSNLGLNNGILLATGNASGAMGPNNDPKHGTCFDANSTFYDPQLTAIEPNATYDGCVLEFDIKPICNTLQIRYVFGSEEYPEYVDSKFNDIFGFFITGPNPAGGSYLAQNIAKLPNGAAVAINNVNNGQHNSGPCMNCSYYVDNTNSSTIQYDGMTTPLTASVNVTPCQTYHLKLAIADAGDCDYDSGVFLEYKGISCANSQIPAVTSNTTVALCDLNNGSATANVTNYAGAVSYVWSPGGQTGATATGLAPGNYVCTMSFQNPCPYTKTVSAVVPHNSGFTFSNSITNIKCPQDVNGSATVTPAGGNVPYTYNWSTPSLQTSATATGLGMGTYICTISDAAGCVKKDSVKIFATTTLASAPTASSALCTNSTGIAYANVTGGVAPYTYSWSTAPAQTASSAINLFPGTYSVTVTDKDGCIKVSAVTVNDFFPTILVNDSIVHATCSQSNGAVYIGNLTGGTNPYQFAWSGGQTTQNVTGLAAGSYTVNVKDANNCPGSKTFAVNNFTYLPIVTDKKDDKCDQKKGYASALVLGGSPPVTYTWSNGQSTPTASNIGQGSYTVNVKDAAGCTNSIAISVSNSNDIFYGTIESYPRQPSVGEDFQIILHPTSIWNLDYSVTSGFTFRDTITVLNYPDYGYYIMQYFLTSVNGCKYSFPYDFFVRDYMTIYFPNSFTANADGLNDFYMPVGTLVKEFKMQIYDRWGEQVFSTDDFYKGWDGKYKGKPAEEAVYTYKAWARDYYDHQSAFVGHFTLIR